MFLYSHFIVLNNSNIQGGAKVGLQLGVHKTRSLFLYYFYQLLYFHMNKCKPFFAESI